MLTINNVYFSESGNVGDAASPPHLYYPELKGEPVPVLGTGGPVASNCCAIVGGGGVIYPDTLDFVSGVRQIADLVVAWGIGTNFHGARGTHYPEWLQRYDLLGLRDANPPSWAKWVPCASCLHSVFDEPTLNPQHDYVLYEHPYSAMPQEWDGPRMENLSNTPSGASSMEEAVRFLASGSAVITNSYHGMYWASLLGRPVTVWRPFSSRFFCSPFNPEFVYTDQLADCVGAARIATHEPDWLVRCRKANSEFKSDVMELIAKHGQANHH